MIRMSLLLLALVCPLALAQDRSGDDPMSRALTAALDTKRVSLDFVDATVPTVIQYLRTVSKINLMLDPEVRDELESQDSRVNLQLEDVSLRAALDVLCDFFNLRYTVRNGVVIIGRSCPICASPGPSSRMPIWSCSSTGKSCTGPPKRMRVEPS